MDTSLIPILLPPPKIEWILDDEFTDTLAAGAVNGTLATDGHSLRTATDGSGKLSQAGGLSVFATGGVGSGNPGRWYPSIPRVIGRAVFADITPAVAASDQAMVGMDTNQTTTIADSIYFRASGVINIVYNGAVVVVGIYTAVNHWICCVMRGAGFFFLIKGGAFAAWTLLLPYYTNSATARFPGMAAASTTAPFTSSFIRVPENLISIIPIASDSFNRAILGSTDGLAVAEVGGAGLAWTGAGAAISGNALAITPTLGNNRIVNGTFDADTDWYKGNSGWTISGGTLNALISSGNPSNSGGLGQGNHTWYFVSIDCVALTVGTFSLDVTGGGDGSPSYNSSGTKTFTLRTSHSGGYLYIIASGITGSFDNVILNTLALTTLFSSLQLSVTNAQIDVEVSALTAGTQCGCVGRLDSAITPANFIIAYFDGSGNVKCDDCVAGVYTNKLSVAKAWTASDHLLLDLLGTAVRLYHITAAGAMTLIGSYTTTITTGLLAGVFSTYASNLVNSFVVWDKNSNYSGLDRYIQP